MEATPDATFRSDAVKFTLIGLMRDLRGIAMATNRYGPFTGHCNICTNNNFFLPIFVLDLTCSRRTHGLLFDWLYPAHMPLLLRAIGHWTDTPEVSKAHR